MALNPLAAIIKAIRGTKYKDTEEYMHDEIRDKKEWH
jgi:hypothetical protein